ncbi:hypothetical protein QBC35DRAFT_445975 [Podospora australis]|uniref:Uncharacterized protein n=1 Tax=Podospora australis TaxID=1536484 RepID=A0AAN6X489_9PEZI|nr:hypothetical protein QBC35DRAFT_445975 [Podospora australis]
MFEYNTLPVDRRVENELQSEQPKDSFRGTAVWGIFMACSIYSPIRLNQELGWVPTPRGYAKHDLASEPTTPTFDWLDAYEDLLHASAGHDMPDLAERQRSRPPQPAQLWTKELTRRALLQISNIRDSNLHLRSWNPVEDIRQCTPQEKQNLGTILSVMVMRLDRIKHAQRQKQLADESPSFPATEEELYRAIISDEPGKDSPTLKEVSSLLFQKMREADELRAHIEQQFEKAKQQIGHTGKFSQTTEEAPEGDLVKTSTTTKLIHDARGITLELTKTSWKNADGKEVRYTYAHRVLSHEGIVLEQRVIGGITQAALELEQAEETQTEKKQTEEKQKGKRRMWR